MLRVLGGALVLLASGSFGITAGVRYYRASRHLQAFCRAIELLRCEINYSLQPLPEGCALVADRLTGPPAAFFRCFAAQLREPGSRDRAAAAAMEAARGLQLPQDAVCLEETGLHKNQLRLPAPPPEKGGQSLLPGAILGDLTGAEVDDAPGAEHIRRQNIFDGTFVIQFDQGVHVPSAFLCFSPLYCAPAENTIDNPPGLSEKGC